MQPSLVFPGVQGSCFTFDFGETRFAVDADHGGRIVSFALGGREVLLPPGPDNNHGSTFWPSPQADWGWPPPAEIDSDPYETSLDGPVLSLSSKTAPGLGLAVRKKFVADAGTGVVTVEYTLVNVGLAPRRAAPWEITRVGPRGVTFFPLGEGAPRRGPQELLPLEIAAGVAFYRHDPAAIRTDLKVFADGAEGWIAHQAGDLLLVKSFPDTKPASAAPGEGEIEVYASPDGRYVEVENQGAYLEIAPGASRSWAVRWVLRRLDPGCADRVRLAERVRAVLRA